MQVRQVSSRYDEKLSLLLGETPASQSTSRTDEHGRYALPVTEPGLWAVAVERDGMVPMEHRPVLVLDDFELPPLVLEVGVPVRIESPAPDRPLPAGRFAVVEQATAEGAEKYHTGWRPRMRTVDLSGGRSATVFAHRENPRLDLRLVGAGRRETVVEDFAGGRVPEAAVRDVAVRVRVTSRDEPLAGVLVAVAGEQWPVAATDASGRAVVLAAAGERLRLLFESSLGLIHAVVVSEGVKGDEVIVALPDPHWVRGRVTAEETGEGLRAVVRLAPDPTRLTWTEEDGTYEITTGTTGSVIFQADAPGRLTGVGRLTPADQRRGRLPTVSLQQAVTLRGSVTDMAGRPVAGVALEAVPETALGPRFTSAPGRAVDRSWTGGRGEFRLTRLREGLGYVLLLRQRGFLPQAVPVVATGAGQRPLVVRLQPTVAVLGRVRDSQGAPVPDALVTIRPALRVGVPAEVARREAPPGEDELTPSVWSDPDGVFALADGPASVVDVEVAKSGFTTVVRRNLRLDSGEGDLGVVVLQPGTPLSGRVTDIDDQPIAGAEIIRVSRLPHASLIDEFAGRWNVAATTGKDGRFLIADLASREPHNLVVRARGFLTGILRAVRLPQVEPLTVRLQEGFPVHGCVADESGTPVAGAEIGLTWKATLPNDPELRPIGLPHYRHSGTGRTGCFEINDSPPGRVLLDVSASGFVSLEELEVTVPVEPESEPLQISLRRGAAVAGQVTTTAGEPVAGARVSVGGQGGRTDADGLFALDGVAVGAQSLDVMHVDHPRMRRPVNIDGPEEWLEVELEGGVEVAGVVLGGGGDVVPGARVTLRGWDLRDLNRYEGRSDADGRFEIPNVATGRYRLSAEAESFASARLAEPLSVEGLPVEGLQIFLPEGARLSGEVLGLDTDSLAGVEVVARDGQGRELHGRVDAEGQYEIARLAPGDWQVGASLNENRRRVDERLVVEPSDRELIQDLEFGGRAVLSGVVYFGDETLADASVSLRGEATGLGRSVRSAFNGSFRLEDLEPDLYLISVQDASRLAAHNEILELRSDRHVEIRIAGGLLHGVVLEAESGDPVVGAQLFLRPIDGPEYLLSVGSGSEGRFFIPNIAGSRYRLEVRAAAYAPYIQELDLTTWDRTRDLVVHVTPAAGATLAVRLASGAVPEVVHVRAQRSDGAVVLAESHQPDAEGVVRLSTLPEGRWDLLLSAPGAAIQRTTTTTPGTMTSVVLPMAGDLAVRIPELTTAHAVAEVRLWDANGSALVVLSGGGALLDRWQVEGGHGMIANVPPGNWRVEASTVDGRTWSATVSMFGAGSKAIVLRP